MIRKRGAQQQHVVALALFDLLCTRYALALHFLPFAALSPRDKFNAQVPQRPGGLFILCELLH